MGNSRYPDKPHKPLREWWNNHIPQSQGKEQTNMPTIGASRNLKEGIELSDKSKWEFAMQEEYEYLIANVTWELISLPKGHNAVKCKWMFARMPTVWWCVSKQGSWPNDAWKWKVWILGKHLHLWPNSIPYKSSSQLEPPWA